MVYLAAGLSVLKIWHHVGTMVVLALGSEVRGLPAGLCDDTKCKL